MRDGIRSLLKSRDFALLWSGNLVSRFGDAISSIAFMWLALKLSGSALIMSTVMVCSMTPSLLFTIPAGAFVDRHSRKRIMMLSSVGRMTLMLTFFLLCFSDRVELWHLYLTTFIDSTVECFFGPALGAVIPKVVDEEHLLSANSAISMTTSISQMIGMGAGGAIVGFIGVPAAFLIDSFTYLAAVISVIFIRIREDMTLSKERNRLEDIKDGFRFVAKRRTLLIAFFVAMILNFGAGALNVIIPVLSDALSLGAEGYGYILASFSAGSLIGAVVLGSVGSSKSISTETLIITMPGVWTLVFLFASFPQTLLPYIVIFLIIGITCAFGGAAIFTILQKSTPDEMRGRVISIEHLIELVMMPFSAAAAGPLIEFYGTSFVFYCVAAISFVAFLVALAGIRKNKDER